MINEKFSVLMNEHKKLLATEFAEMHRLIAECDRAEAHALEVIAKCK